MVAAVEILCPNGNAEPWRTPAEALDCLMRRGDLAQNGGWRMVL
jgi:hypothetical protein